MNYEEALSFIHSLDKFGSRPGLERVRKLFDFTPEILDQRFIHIAGTNGKGSVCAMIESVLRSAGYTTGLFTSPYIVDFRERVRINGEFVQKQELAEAVERYIPALEQLNRDGIIITEFEFLTVIAFYIFKRRNVDVVVCEVGMGGLFDSTNVIEKPLCSVITRVDLDHTAVLGDTLELIAKQKCGIIKKGSFTVSSAQLSCVKSVIECEAKEKENELYFADDAPIYDLILDKNGAGFTYLDTKMRLPMTGAHQAENLKTALTAISKLKGKGLFDICALNIRDGLSSVSHPARFEKLRDDPIVIIDGAHNRNGMEAFVSAVREYYPKEKKTLIIGMLADKDDQALSLLKGMFERIITTDIDNPRALSAQSLADKCKGLSDSVKAVPDVREAYKTALSYGDSVFVCGSLYLASQIRPIIISD